MTGPTSIALTMGDPAGVGPEIIVKALPAFAPRLAAGELELILVGATECFREAARRLGTAFDPATIDSSSPRAGRAALLAAGVPTQAIKPGVTSAEAGRLAFRAIEEAVRLAVSGRVDAIATAPLSKEALNLAGFHYSGHTELLADLTGARDSAMLLLHGDMRVSHVSTHVALSEAVKRLTPQRLRRVVEMTVGALRRLGIERPRIAIAALNPHAGEGGMFGREDLEITTPVIAQLRAEGHEIEGPVPGDTVFVKLRGRRYDAVVAMYHDQGHIPVKLLGFSVDPVTGKWDALSGVNVTLGLPIVRTSVDHGTAFDIAGKGIANERSLIEAIDCAIQLGAARSKAAA
ncbi:4-hydroxythreonine-4-phosphate dehydrogenase 1 [Hypericibacter terrae]|uniref:4-hydroxythreonine-4-phosphate dehydrogenase 1 n=1 Tax=Hypericibacter terrae TaxID=2602015 RepID=A0A5J6MLE8_9PROT|nr:4-hydroxythreonine-4-phosphate dehydrogenase PdxA [Hypericibacter terrae]QEX18368.1 4-hydroxythreonine-4-phosphate dehydrogenase 1 [Hypericibacter terrae]